MRRYRSCNPGRHTYSRRTIKQKAREPNGAKVGKGIVIVKAARTPQYRETGREGWEGAFACRTTMMPGGGH